MDSFKHFITILIIQPILDAVSAKGKSNKTRSIYCFNMRPFKELAIIGWIGTVFFSGCLVLSKMVNQLDSFPLCVFGGLLGISLILVLAPVKGFWDATVKDNTITVSRLWVFRKTVNISDIDYCTIKKGGINVYIKGKRRKAFQIDGMSTNITNFEKRMEKEGIEIR